MVCAAGVVRTVVLTGAFLLVLVDTDVVAVMSVVVAISEDVGDEYIIAKYTIAITIADPSNKNSVLVCLFIQLSIRDRSRP